MTAKSKLQRAKNKKWEDLFAYHLQLNGMLKHFGREVRFIPGRQFRLDFGDPIHKIGVEIQGGIWAPSKMGHNSGGGIMADHTKMNLGHLHGWRIFQFSDNAIRDLTAIDLLRRYYIQNLNIELQAAGKPN